MSSGCSWKKWPGTLADNIARQENNEQGLVLAEWVWNHRVISGAGVPCGQPGVINLLVII